MPTRIDFQKDPDYEPVLQALLEKTREGKLDWQETANEDVFLAAVRGVQTFQISGEQLNPRMIAGMQVPNYQVTLLVQDSEGNPVFETPSFISGTAVELFKCARRIATRVDAKIDRTMQLLSSV